MAADKQKNKNRVYWSRCSVCQYMKKNREFRTACMNSTYFNAQGTETLLEVNDRYGNPFKIATMYRHMKVHQPKDIEHAEAAAKVFGEPSKVWQRNTVRTVSKREAELAEIAKASTIIASTEAVVDAETDTVPRKVYEVGLDDFIALGNDRVKRGDMQISAANYISAIKVRADIDKSKKDRKLDMLKTMFAGAAPKQDGQA